MYPRLPNCLLNPPLLCRLRPARRGGYFRQLLYLLIILGVNSLFSGCSQLVTQKTGTGQLTSPPEYWFSRGKIAVHNFNPKSSQPARQVLGYRCEQTSDRFLLELSGAMGFGRLKIEQDENGATLHRGNKLLAQAASLDSLLLIQAGLELSVNQLKYWVLGLALPNKPLASLTQQADSDKSQINGFVQDGWTIQYPLTTTVEGWLVPAKITGSNQNLELKIVIKEWRLSHDAPKIAQQQLSQL